MDGKSAETFAQMEEKYRNDPEYMSYSLLSDISADVCERAHELGANPYSLWRAAGVKKRRTLRFLQCDESVTLLEIVRHAKAVGLNVHIELRKDD